MKKDVIIVTLIFISSTFIQLLSQILITRIYGASTALDNFLAAVTIPTIIVTVIYGTLGDAFLPIYSKLKKNVASSDSYFSSSLIVLSFVGLVIAVFLNLIASPLMAMIFNSSTLDIEEVSRQFSFMIYTIPLAIVATLFGSHYYTHKNFYRFPFTQLWGSLSNLGFFLLLYQVLAIWSLVIAFVINIFLQILVIIPRIKFSLAKIDLKPLVWAWLPLLIGAIALRSDILLIRVIGVHFGEGYLVYLNLISKIFSLSTSLITIGIQVLLLPHLVEHVNSKNYNKLNKLVIKSKLSALILSIFVTLVLYFIGPILIRTLFVGGSFTEEDYNKTMELFPIFIIPAIGWGVNTVFFQPLIALQKHFIFGVINIVSLLLSWFVSFYLLSIGMGVWTIGICLSVLLFGGIIGSEVVWQIQKRKIQI